MEIVEDLIMRGGLAKDEHELFLFKRIKFSMYPARAFSITLQKLYQKKDLGYIKTLGKIIGDNSAKLFKEELNRIGSLINKEYQTVPNLIEISGFGKIKEFKIKNKKIAIKITNHPVISFSKERYGKDSCSCFFYGEIYKSFIETFFEQKIKKINHNKCVCFGNSFCEWVFEK